ncbi:MAG TPA: SDR family NAD(P)-dependent oxidoreductase, partial [Rhodanobacteraceae bacterium]|nr:SDR family NAD(P)-dependent oxidoreductase [Rhodanobacteraceae bacterium]
AQLEAQLDINLRTAFNATRAVLPHMLERGRGFVLGVGAAAALDGGASMGAYAAAKAALIAWLKSVDAELAPRGIDVSILYPMAAVDTPGNRRAMPKSDPALWIDPAELAATALHLATRGRRGRLREARVYPPA